MRKIVALVLCLVCLLALNACGIERNGVEVTASDSAS